MLDDRTRANRISEPRSGSINLPEKQVIFEVPLFPPSVNHRTKDCFYKGRDGSVHRGKKLTPEVKAFEFAVAIFARNRTVIPELPSQRRNAKYRVEIHVYYGPKMRGDADNFSKAVLDSIVKCGVIHSDTHVDFHIVPHKDERSDPRNPRTVYTVERL
jgi:Holliday junction resolvase RusA-like endonuclease